VAASSERLSAETNKNQVTRYVWSHVSPHLVLAASTAGRYAFDLMKEEVVPNERDDSYSLSQVYLKLGVEYKYKGGPKARVTGPSARTVQRMAADRYHLLAAASQRVLLPSLYDRLVKIDAVSLTMSPLRTILVQLDEDGQVTPQSAFRRKLPPREKIDRYFKLLEDLEYIKKSDSHYVPGTNFQKLATKKVHSPEIFGSILSDVISLKSDYLTNVLHWTMMVPYLRWSNAYYFKSLEAGQLTPLDRTTYVDSYSMLYGTGARGNELSQLTHLMDASILHKEDSYYIGEQSVFQSFNEHARRDEELMQAMPTLG
jgi:hypothetical protein